MNETVAELRKQVKDPTDERDRLATQTVTAAPPDLGVEVESLKSRLAAVIQEKEMSAKLLTEEMNKAVKAAADHEAALVSTFDCDCSSRLLILSSVGSSGREG